MSFPRHALDSWKTIARRMGRASHLAVFTDFDGTLVRIRRRPEDVVLPPNVRHVLAAIARSGVTLGVVSGREVADLRRRVNLDRIWYAGAHGFFIRDPHNRSIGFLRPAEKQRIRAISQILTQRLDGVPGLRLEPKEATISVHYRAAPERSVRIARGVVSAIVQRHPEICLLRGKKVWGFLPGTRTDKWSAISFILQRARPSSARGRSLTIFLGDDATDERVFRQMRGISVSVGRKHRTRAGYYLRSPAEVVRLLEKIKALADARFGKSP
ncbi:MAG TPA: trehalose-phosphatase [Candidatus Limnocylindrales bacterium]|nr:trehalose-phosphatase [Candidatus Limnocylindrales bacterium]